MCASSPTSAPTSCRCARPRGAISFASGGSDGANLHRNKRSVIVDLATDEGHAVLLRLVERADVLVENFRPGVKHRLRIDPDTLCGR